MAYFECIVGNGGGGGTDIPLIVNCDAAFAGLTITATQGQLSYAETCPSTSPYQVVFHLPQDGTWTISGTIEGTPYSESITISAFEVDLKAGFDYEAWLTAGGIDPTGYADLAAVFADEAAVRKLMLVHASADYLAGKVSDDVDTLDDFVANDTAMKWLGLSDYLVDKLVAITGAEAKLLGSTYWERYLKDHVPTMTSNTAPYGTIIFSSDFGGTYPCWKAFDGDKTTGGGPTNAVGAYVGYTFVNPINIKKAVVRFRTGDTDTFKIQVSSDNFTSDIRDIDTITNPTLDTDYVIDFSSDYGYVTSARLYQTTKNSSLGGTSIFHLQFYGRSLDVSVPTMTSNVLPYGEASASTLYQSTAYLGFTATGARYNPDFNVPYYLAYDFTHKCLIKKVFVWQKTNNYTNYGTCKIQGSNDGFVSDINDLTEDITTTYSSTETLVGEFDLTTETEYKQYRVYCTKTGSSSGNGGTPHIRAQFYGLDYSEKEFEAGTTKKWIYDHGVEVMSLGTAITQGSSSIGTKNADYLYEKISASNTAVAFIPTDSINFNNYSVMRIRLGDIYYTSSSYVILGIGVKTARSYSSSDHSLLAEATFKTGVNPSALGLGISSITNTAYAVAGIYATSNQTYEASIKEWWLE